ncbi:hypothetical protein ITP53_04075 [Nonomuraea sp. K274]|uniref:JAB domain-containing protein n=1 Tax=Nonomuraea cypriaca TaxID=1187855 RepID=A0A931A541_9ACTN|nr:hypothetical protein [Nonomuraea cypriaca]MBF8184929.1 hypothetical protein [Nonomuraea cypriaca]
MTTPNPRLTIDAALFEVLLHELARRGQGSRESGAFLLAGVNPITEPQERGETVVSLAFYDDLDENCLTGAISFGADGYTTLGMICRDQNLRVVGDIHTHPRAYVGQSKIDAAHPMVALPGHIAIIAPRFAQDPITISELGVHVFGGRGHWTSHFGDDVADILHVHASHHTVSKTAATFAALRRWGARLKRRISPWSSQ